MGFRNLQENLEKKCFNLQFYFSRALVANKIDQEHLRTVKSDRHHRFAQVINGLIDFLVKSLTSHNVVK